MRTWRDIGTENAKAANEELRHRSQAIASQNQSDLLSDVVEELKEIKGLLKQLITQINKS
jgi:hypothetical protein